MKLLVLGTRGQLGAELAAQASGHGFEAVGLGSEDLDVTDQDAVRSTLDRIEPGVLVNATAYHVVPECDRHPDRAFAVNAVAVKTMAEACSERGVAFATFSTDYVFDGRKGTPYVEDDRPNPLQTYGVSKLAGEQLCALYDADALIVRTCGVYGGPGGSRAKRGNFVLTMLREARTKPSLEVSSEQVVSPTYAADLAGATLGLIARRPAGGLYHLVNEGNCSWADFAAEIVACAGGSMKIVPVDRGGHSGAVRRPRFSALANVRAADLGVTLPSWKDGVRRYVPSLGEPPGS